LSSVVRLALLHFSKLFLQLFSETFFILRIQQDSVINLVDLCLKYTYACQILIRFEFS
jgi:hypothetical protein